MSSTTVWAQYEQRLGRVCDHIHSHLDDDLDMDILADVACLSRYHWHRIYRAIYGETITATVKRLRLNRAAEDLSTGNLPTSKIARRAGYPNLQSFNRTFKNVYGLPPGKFRKQRRGAEPAGSNETQDTDMFAVRIKDQRPLKIAGLPHQGPYGAVGIVFEKVHGLAAARGLYGPDQQVIGIYYDDPDVVDKERLRSFAGLSVPATVPIDPPMETTTIAGGIYAIFRVKGPYANMEACYEWIFSTWLKSSGKMLRDEPGFARYLNPAQNPPDELLSDIYIPLAQ